MSVIDSAFVDQITVLLSPLLVINFSLRGQFTWPRDLQHPPRAGRDRVRRGPPPYNSPSRGASASRSLSLFRGVLASISVSLYLLSTRLTVRRISLRLRQSPQIRLWACLPTKQDSCTPTMHRLMHPPNVPAQLRNHRNVFHACSQGRAPSTASSATASNPPRS